MAQKNLHTFLFADLSGYSSLTEREGDEAAAEVAIRFAAEARRLAEERGIELVKRVGDAVMLRGEDARAVVELGLCLQDEIAGRSGMPEVHAGVHTGFAVERGGDWWGGTVNIAARVATAAQAGQLLITETTRIAAGDLGETRLRHLGPKAFRNISRPVSVYAADSPPDPERTLAPGPSIRHRRSDQLQLKLALPVAA